MRKENSNGDYLPTKSNYLAFTLSRFFLAAAFSFPFPYSKSAKNPELYWARKWSKFCPEWLTMVGSAPF